MADMLRWLINTQPRSSVECERVNQKAGYCSDEGGVVVLQEAVGWQVKARGGGGSSIEGGCDVSQYVESLFFVCWRSIVEVILIIVLCRR